MTKSEKTKWWFALIVFSMLCCVPIVFNIWFGFLTAIGMVGSVVGFAGFASEITTN